MSKTSAYFGTRSQSPILPASVALAASFILTYALDEVLHRMKEDAGTTFHFQPYILLSAILPPFVIAGFFALASFILRRLAPSRAVAGICLVAGLFIAVQHVSFLFGIPPWLRATPVGRFHVAVMTFGSESLLYFLASTWIVIGIAEFRRAPSSSSPDQRSILGAA